MQPAILDKNRAYILAIISGLLCLVFAGFGIDVHFDYIRITLVWSVIFPIIVAMAYGGKYGIIAGLSGGALFPFILWASNGYANILNALILITLFYGSGKVINANHELSYYKTKKRIAVFMGLLILYMASLYLGLFNLILSLNPPFWNPDAITRISPEILRNFLIKDSMNFLFCILFAELLLRLPKIRKLMGLRNYSFMKYNQKMLLASLLIGVIIYLVFIGLHSVLMLQQKVPAGYYNLVLLVIIWSSVIVVRILFRFIEKNAKSEQTITHMEQQFRLVFEHSMDAILWLNAETGNIILCNDAATRLFEKTKNELINLHYAALFPDQHKELYKQYYQEMIQEQSAKKFNVEIVTPSGGIRKLELSSTIVHFQEHSIVQGVFIDITENIRMIEALKNSEKRLKAIFETVNVGMGITDSSGNYIVVNKWWTEKMGYETEDMRFKSHLQITHPNDRTSGHQYFQEILQGGIDSFRMEKRFIKQDRSIFWGDQSVSAIRDEAGNVSHVIEVIHDITEKKLAEEALERRLNALTRPLDDPKGVALEDLFNLSDIQKLQDEFAMATGVASMITHPDGRPITTSSNFCRFCDLVRKTSKGKANCYKSDAFIGSPSRQGPTIHTCLSGGLWDAGAAIMVGGHHIANWLIGQVRDEHQNEEQIRAYAYEIGLDEHQAVEAFCEVPMMSVEKFESIAQVLYTLAKQLSENAYQNLLQARFIAERKTAEEALKSNEARQSAMIANISDIIVIISPEGTINFVSPNVKKRFGWKTSNVLGNMVWDYFFKDDKHLVGAFFSKVLNKYGLTETLECRFKHANGSYKWIEATATNCIDDKDINGILMNFKDISERKQAFELEKEISVTRRSAEFKQKFLANMSHEIRTPLTGVLGMLEILGNTNLDSTQKDYVNTLKQSGENLREIINLILDYSKIEAGQLKLKKQVFELDDIIADAHKLFISICNKNIQWECISDPKLPKYINTDKHRVNQIIRNLISNAVKFTEKGKITLRLSSLYIPLPSFKGNVMLRIDISDTGKGIASDKIDHVFDPFYQIDDENSRIFDGTGLGLPICKELVSILGGEMGVSSIEGKGSNFWFTFSAGVSEKPIAPAISDKKIEAGKKLNIMVVEDKVVNQKVISLLLKSLGHSVSLACNGQEAIDKYRTGEFDLILMDIQMPVMDGITATQKLRAMFPNLPPVVGLSANAFEGDREKYMLMGLDEYIRKPIDINDFQSALIKLKF